MTAKNHKSVNRTRRAGVLLHPTSLPGPLDNGDIGHQAYRFIEFLNTHGFKVWQMLPLGPTHVDKSPYKCISSHAGNPLLISLDWLVDKGWLDREKIEINENNEEYRVQCLQYASNIFYNMNDEQWMQRLDEFSTQHRNWLDDYVLYMALKSKYQAKPWYEWPAPVRNHEAAALERVRQELQNTIKTTRFEQFVFFVQWQEIRIYAKQHDVELFGDMPIFVALDSADVWAKRENFLVEHDGSMQYIAGVPPDAFSDTGQRWGNPLYDWDYMQSNGFSWWKDRFETQLEIFDLVRIDHFRGLQACWQIPNADDTAINGRWVEVPGREMLEAVFDSFNYLPLIAEDLGVITDAVIALKKSFDLPGMKVLQFAFDGSKNNPHLPHNHQKNDLVYTGTHDNDTTLGWLCDEENYNKNFLEEYIDAKLDSTEQGTWKMLRLAMSSVSFLSVIPMQDMLLLDSTARMNIPGTEVGNWEWRFDWQWVKPDALERLSRLLVMYER